MVDMVREMKAAGLTILLSEQNMRFASRISERAYLIERGTIKYEGLMATIANDPAIYQTHLAV
jgi:branched-chain amino acid transport system ATP-binding protein